MATFGWQQLAELLHPAFFLTPATASACLLLPLHVMQPWVESLTNASGATLGPDSDVPWLKVSPSSMRGVLKWLTQRYGSSWQIRVTENGVPVPNESAKSVAEALRDEFRVEFYREYLNELCLAVALDNVNVRGFYAWSLLVSGQASHGGSCRGCCSSARHDHRIRLHGVAAQLARVPYSC
jgi:beta-glucosidase/6-phospho-beta-glucosidase/beta-galactosidase